MSLDLGKHTRAHIAQSWFWLDGHPYSLYDYPFLPAVYNTGAREVLMKTGRQISKSCHEDTPCLMANGSTRRIRDIEIGDSLVTLTKEWSHLCTNPVTWKSDRYRKLCVEVTTRLGYVVTIATTHPMRCWDSWVPAGKLRIGDFVATPRRAGVFQANVQVEDDLVAFAGFMLGDGCCGVSKNFNFTQKKGTLANQEFRRICQRRKWKTRITVRTGSDSINLSQRPGDQSPREAAEIFGLWGESSATKSIPEIIWRLNRRQTALFLNRLWSTDGHVTKRKSACQIGYSSISRSLSAGVQRLLQKFGIPSSLTTWQPNVYKGTKKRVYTVRVETRSGAEKFIQEIGALGKSEHFQLPETSGENNNRDVVPKAVEKLIQEINASAGTQGRVGTASNKETLFAAGLRKTLKYPPTYRKVGQYVDHFSKYSEYDQHLVAKLRSHLDTDLYWDRVVSIEPKGMQACYDISVQDTENFVSGGIVSHNSTTCACLMLSDSVAIEHFRTLYVSPTREQTSKFSNTRLAKMIHYSPLIRDNFIDTDLPNNVLLQILGNGSELALSYAWDDPDRIRGITADRELIDEVQDIVYDAVIPVVKECMANSDYALMIYCGTPKSMENTIEFLWQKSTQSEWIMKCESCGSWGFVDDARSIGRHGIVCLKCDKYLNPRLGQWYDMNSNATMKGFHISQPMLPRNVEIPTRWERILEKLDGYGDTQFKNEVLGVSDDTGSRFISQGELLGLCEDYYVDLPLTAEALDGIRLVVGGVDWAGNSDNGLNSRTVCWVWGLTDDFRFKTLYFRIFPKANSIEDVDEVVRIFEECQCRYVVGDAGEGAVSNSQLRNKLGAHRVGQAQYGGGSGFSQLIRWNRQGTRYLVNRTASVDSFMLLMKKQGVIFPNARQTAVPIQDIMNVYQESTHSGQGGSIRSIWKHAPNCPDDSLHAMIFGWLAMKVVQGELQFYDKDG